MLTMYGRFVALAYFYTFWGLGKLILFNIIIAILMGGALRMASNPTPFTPRLRKTSMIGPTA